MNRTNSAGNHGESDERDDGVQRVDDDDTFPVYALLPIEGHCTCKNTGNAPLEFVMNSGTQSGPCLTRISNSTSERENRP